MIKRFSALGVVIILLAIVFSSSSVLSIKTASAQTVSTSTPGLVVSSASATRTVLNQNGVVGGYAVTYTVTLTNTNTVTASSSASSTKNYYISTNSLTALDVSTLGSTDLTVFQASSTYPLLSEITSSSVSPAMLAGDVPGAYFIPAGASRTFIYRGYLLPSGNAGNRVFTITKIKYGLTPSSVPTKSITSGLNPLSITVPFIYPPQPIPTTCVTKVVAVQDVSQSQYLEPSDVVANVLQSVYGLFTNVF